MDIVGLDTIKHYMDKLQNTIKTIYFNYQANNQGNK